MMLRVYESTEKLFTNNGLKILKPFNALIRKEDNGDYYIDIEASLSDLEYLQEGMIIRTTTPWDIQGFRLTSPEITNRKIKIRGWHLSYDTSRYMIADSNVIDANCNTALDKLNSECDVATPFTFTSDITGINSYHCTRQTLEEALNTVLEIWGGHLTRDNFNIGIKSEIGVYSNLSFSYAHNIKEIKAVEDWSNVVTKILAVGKDDIVLPELYLNSKAQYDIPYTKMVKFEQNEIDLENFKTDSGYTTVNTTDGLIFSENTFFVNENGEYTLLTSKSDLDTAITAGSTIFITNEYCYNQALISDLRRQALDYLEKNSIPKVSYTTDAYLNGLNLTDIGDIVTVKHPKCNIDLETEVTALEYDAVADRYTKVEFGNYQPKLSNLLSKVDNNIENAINNEVKPAQIQITKKLEQATAQIWGHLGNSYVIYDGSDILVVDKLPKEQATNVMMINSGGIGFSNSGINGTFNSAWTLDGTFNAQNINVINFAADLIKGGTLKLGGQDNISGDMEVFDTDGRLISSFNKDGLKVYSKDGSIVQLSTNGVAGYDASGVKSFWAEFDEFHINRAFVEKDITFVKKIRIIPIQNDTNNGIGFVCVNEEA